VGLFRRTAEELTDQEFDIDFLKAELRRGRSSFRNNPHAERAWKFKKVRRKIVKDIVLGLPVDRKISARQLFNILSEQPLPHAKYPKYEWFNTENKVEILLKEFVAEGLLTVERLSVSREYLLSGGEIISRQERVNIYTKK
jgi:hypothetical protein